MKYTTQMQEGLMNKILIASIDMEIGGVERSLISMLNYFDYENNQVDLMLYSHSGDFISLLPSQANLLREVKAYRTFRMPISQIIKSGNFPIGMTRLYAKLRASLGDSSENGYRQMQYMWKYALPFLPKSNKKYDIAISYLWPHYFVAEKVNATKKIAWIHTDYSMADTDMDMDIAMWNKFDHLIAVSDGCRNAFIKKYPILKEKLIVMENIAAPDIVRSLANEKINSPMFQDERFKIITVARLSYAKGIDQAIRAFKVLKDRGYHNLAWYVVGYGGDEDDLRQLITKLDLEKDFILLGKQTNPYPFIKDADLYVQPSRYEGKAVTVGEAQILAKPVLITNYPTAQSQVIDKVDGMICDLSVEGIADGIETLYLDPEQRNLLESNCKNKNHNNSEQLNKLYELI